MNEGTFYFSDTHLGAGSENFDLVRRSFDALEKFYWEHYMQITKVVDLGDTVECWLPDKKHENPYLDHEVIVAARNIGSEPNESIVVEDAASGVAAGRNGKFGLVLGIARENNQDELMENGADIVVDDLSQVSLDQINQQFKKFKEKNEQNRKNK